MYILAYLQNWWEPGMEWLENSHFWEGGGFDVDEYEEAVTNTLNGYSEVVVKTVVDGGYRVHLVDITEYYLVKWVGTPRLVKKS